MRTPWLGSLLVSVALAISSCGGNTVEPSGKKAGSGGASSGSAGASGSAGRSGSPGSGGTGVAAAGGSTFGGTGGTSGSAGAPDFAACSLPSDCLVRPRSCCGQCGAATREDVIAINHRSASDYTLAVCQGSACPACYAPPDPTLLAGCENGFCAVVDLSRLPLTECKNDLDCRLRTASCCECGGNVSQESLVAIRKDSEAEFQRLVCGPSGMACPECQPIYPERATAKCFAGRCTVTGNSGTTPV